VMALRDEVLLVHKVRHMRSLGTLSLTA
jgi:hypothetical protein